MDSRVETYKHIYEVQKLMLTVINDLLKRQLVHDQSKLTSPEVELFDEYTPKLANSVYGSEEYKGFLEDLKPALDHHYTINSHHPEFHFDGIKGMSLIDLLEMICDWKAATMRHSTGDILKSIEINQKRFGYSDELKQIFINTVRIL
jgi:hypothetical protein